MIEVTTPKRFVSLAAGAFHLLALDSEGGTYGWGSNKKGQLGLRPSKAAQKKITTPMKIESLTPNSAAAASEVVCGSLFSLAFV